LTGSRGPDFPALAPRPNAPVGLTHGSRAFTNPGLDESRKRRGIRRSSLAGVASDRCGDSTGREGYFPDYHVAVVAECGAAAVEREHRVALEGCGRDCGAVVNSADVAEAWQRSGTPVRRPLAVRMG